MVPLPFDKLENLIPLLHERFEELAEKRSLNDKDALHHVIKEGYVAKTLDCYVDDVDHPGMFVALIRVRDFWDNPPMVLVQAVFIRKHLRGSSGRLDAVIVLVNTYAKFYNVKYIVASSPCRDDGTPMSQIWEKAGFVRSDISYTKKL